jgi:nitronate monooxygenase
LLSPEDVPGEVAAIRKRTTRPLNLNFFCDSSRMPDEESLQAWHRRLAAFYREFGLEPPPSPPVEMGRLAFDESMTGVVEEVRPEVVSFQFGLPAAALLERVRATGATVWSTATTVAEAKWLEDHGVDAVVAQGFEAGGHRGMFLTDDVSTQVGTMALVPQVADAVSVPVIAAGGIADGRGVAAALALGADAVQIGTAYLLCPEATISPLHREALAAGADDGTTVTNVFTGRPARAVVNRLVTEVGPLSDAAPSFPFASAAIMPLRAAAEGSGSSAFTSMWSGQAARLAHPMPAGELTRRLASEAKDRLRAIGL